LFFNPKLSMPVYKTYVGKPHHLNHRTENAKAARGLIIDAHYNDASPALTTCPRCKRSTKERRDRDSTGIHCKCGQVVKDEFVEILVGIDADKDPLFADGVRKGLLKAGSMGCNCLSTTCNVCGHVAYSKPEFCEHIKAGNKGTLWRREGSRWVKTSASDAAREFARRKLAFNPADFCYAKRDDFEIRKAYEYCVGVIFDEYSRVDQPADPKAEQIEILKAASELPSADTLRDETQALIRSAERKRKEMEKAAATKTAERYTVVRLNRDPASAKAAPDIRAALEAADPQPGDAIEACQGNAEDERAAAIESKEWNWTELAPEDAASILGREKEGFEINLEEGDPPFVVNPPEGMGEGVPGEPGMEPGAPGPAPMGIEQYTEQVEEEVPNEGLDEENLGITGPLPLGGSAPRRTSGRRTRMSARTFAPYNDWKVEVSEKGNARLITAEKVPVFVVQAAKPIRDPDAQMEFGREILASVLDDGLVATAKKYKAHFSPRFAQVVEHAVDDMQGFDDKYMYNSVREQATENDDMSGNTRGGPPKNTRQDPGDDMAGQVRGNPPDKTTEDGAADHARNEGTPEGVAREDGSDMRDKRKPVEVGKQNVLDDEVHDHVEPLSRSGGVAPIPGMRVASKKNPKKSFVVQGTLASEGKEAQHWGPYSVIVVRGSKDNLEQKRVAERDWLGEWMMLDKQPATLRLPGQPERQFAAGKGELPEFLKNKDEDDEGKEKDEKCAAKTAERLEKFAKARVEKAKREAEERIAAVEKDMEKRIAQAQDAAIKSFCRALRVVAGRYDTNLEKSALKEAMFDHLAEPRVVGRDAATGNDIVSRPMEHDLAVHIIESVWQAGHGRHLEASLKRAREVMKKGDAFLIAAEDDLKNLKPAIPPVTAVAHTQVDEAGLHAEQLRRQAADGNLELTPAPAADSGNGHDKRAQIRGALGGSLVEAARGRLGLN
jgi:hypothetical protein